MAWTLGELAARVDGQVRGDADLTIAGVATLENATADRIAFLSNPKFRKFLESTRAGAVIVTASDAEQCPVNALVVDDPYVTYARVAALLHPEPRPAPGVHDSAVVAETAQVDPSASVGPQCVVEDGAVIGADSIIGPGCAIGANVTIGQGSRLYANVTIYREVVIGERVIVHAGTVIGSDGFGIANDRGTWVKIPQLGSVIVGDDVEIGASCAVDRGALEDTRIENGVKIDNQVQIAHNVQIGAHTAIAANVGIAGSTRIGQHCAIGGAAGIAGHIEIVDHVQITGMAMITKSITEPGVYSSGIPAEPNRRWRRSVARFRKLEEVFERLEKLEDCILTKR